MGHAVWIPVAPRRGESPCHCTRPEGRVLLAAPTCPDCRGTGYPRARACAQWAGLTCFDGLLSSHNVTVPLGTARRESAS